MKYENPNCSAFFFDDGDFLNLEVIAGTTFYNIGEHFDDDGDPNAKPRLEIDYVGTEQMRARCSSKKEHTRLSDALRIYHSKL